MYWLYYFLLVAISDPCKGNSTWNR